MNALFFNVIDTRTQELDVKKKNSLLTCISRMKDAHQIACDAIADISGNSRSIDGSASLTVTREMFQQYREAVRSAGLLASQAQIILAEFDDE
ncbi:hypothetical protein PQR62_01690 [Herbaspirillum lusitanum]|jgi:hypothetical protein|uniref:Uncharacterized protein n=1 Tax=Herbaspirillum lusitanum TaxID=213312 RepID=A0ABW9A3F2_9BURK